MSTNENSRLHAVVDNVLGDQYEFLVDALDQMSKSSDNGPTEFAPPWQIPELSDKLLDYFGASRMSAWTTSGYAGRDVSLLDLTGNERTRTTKTFASLVMVARAVRHIQLTGEPITLLTPTSANKGTALRDAVLRAIEAGLAGPDELNIVTVVPAIARAKLWSSPLSADADLSRRNPVAVVDTARRDGVKEIARSWYEQHAARYFEITGSRLWYTLDIRNYQVADAMRACFEQRYLPAKSRVHVHAVSSAYGLLGHHFGESILQHPTSRPSQYFLVQHLGTPDMVLHMLHDDCSRKHLPRYHYNQESGLHYQTDDPHFPAETADPDEFLENTFYTSVPPTSDDMSAIIRNQGGGGVVVSLRECLSRYSQARALLADTSVQLPPDPRDLREWSLAMAITGALNAIDRDLMPGSADIMIHASGSYGVDDFTPIPADQLRPVRASSGLTPVMFGAAAASGTPEVA